MKSVFIAAAAACLVSLVALPASAQVSNSLGAETETPILPDPGPSFVRIDPEEIKALLVAEGLVITAEEALPDVNGKLMMGTVGQGVLFIYLFSQCGEDGCLVLQQVHPIPTSLAGLRVSPVAANAINTGFPFGSVYTDEDGNMIYRYALLSAPECAIECQKMHLRAHVAAAQQMYGIIDQMMKQQSVSLERQDLASLPNFHDATSLPGRQILPASFVIKASILASAGDGEAISLPSVMRAIGMEGFAEALPVVTPSAKPDRWAPLVPGEGN